MLVLKGDQINNVQLITGLRIAEMSQLQNYSVMCTRNGSYCENKKREKKSGGGGMCTKNGSYCEKEKSQGGQGRCERGSEALMIFFLFVFCCCCFFFFFFFVFVFFVFFCFFFLGGGGRVGGSG